jgi:Icc-related predicted phosphoesterase
VKVVAAADLHGHLPAIDPCDLLVLGGDLCPDFKAPRNEHWGYGLDTTGHPQANWLDTTFRDWLQTLRNGGVEEIVGIAGNHDFAFGNHVHPTDLPWTYLEDAETAVGGLRVYGTPWVPNLPFWAFYGDERKLELRAAAIPEGIDVLVTHGPPFGYADLCSPNAPSAGTRVGEPAIEAHLQRIKPRAVVCGHIHENWGVYEHPSGASIYSVSIMDDLYEPREEPASFVL